MHSSICARFGTCVCTWWSTTSACWARTHDRIGTGIAPVSRSCTALLGLHLYQVAATFAGRDLNQRERGEDAECCYRRGITWMTKDGLRKPNYWGSLTQAATCRVGNYKGEEVHAPFSSLLPMVHPNDLVLGGWDISNLNLADAMERAKV